MCHAMAFCSSIFACISSLVFTLLPLFENYSAMINETIQSDNRKVFEDLNSKISWL